MSESPKPRKSERRQRGVLVSVRFTPDELAVVQERADGRPVSTYLRELALAIDDASELRGWRGSETAGQRHRVIEAIADAVNAEPDSDEDVAREYGVPVEAVAACVEWARQHPDGLET